MNANDSTLISAYLDDELDRKTRDAVAGSVLSSPALRAELEDVTDVRALISGLARVTPPHNLAPLVEEQIRAEATARNQRRVMLQRSLSLTAHAVAAAALLCAGVLGWKLAQPGPAPRSIRLAEIIPLEADTLAEHPGGTHGDAVAELTAPGGVGESDAVLADGSSVPSAVAKPLPAESGSKPRSGALSEHAVPDILASDVERDRKTTGLEELLRGPEIHRVLVRVDRLDNERLQSVREAITATNRQNARHAEINIWQDVRIDPEIPGAAVVFVVALDEVERASLKQRLVQIFPGGLHEDPEQVDPSLVAQLTQMPKVELFDGTPRGTLLAMPPWISDRFEHALRSTNQFEEQIRVEQGAFPMMPGLPIGPFVVTGRADSSGPYLPEGLLSRFPRHPGRTRPNPFDRKSGASARTGEVQPPRTYLIWITTA